MTYHESRVVGTKVCKKCGRELHVMFFAACHSSVDGLQGTCRECGMEHQSAKRRREKANMAKYKKALLGKEGVS